ncbi:MAG: UDP-2,3-diacylglucosamine diphosphatase [Porphyromonadaceae bacterium]|nr:UDP-2,3-diacylglucosamine diphosphatase [Porphyromonadaceae bacterium]
MGKTIYFLSDLHLGAKTVPPVDRLERERRVVRWLDRIKPDASALYLLGDILDYWYEYRYVVPRGFARFFGKIAEFTDAGIEVHWFIGNHDIWIFDYLPSELGIIVHRSPCLLSLGRYTAYLAHGDGLGRTPFSFRFIRRIFRSRFCQALYAAIHPRWTVPFAHRWSVHSRTSGVDLPYQGEEGEFLVRYAQEYSKVHPVPHIDFFIFGHRHIMLDLMLAKDCRVVILGDWIHHFSFARFDGERLVLEQDLESEEN